MEIQLSFLLTRPSRDVTDAVLTSAGIQKFLLTRPSRDVTDQYNDQDDNNAISTHTSLAGRDTFRRVDE